MAQRLCVATIQEAEAIISKFEVEHTVQFSVLSSTKSFGKITLDDHNNDCVRKGRVCVRLKDPQPAKTTLVIHPEDDSPFAILGKKVMDCIHGRDFRVNKKLQLRESKAILGLTQRREIDSKRKNCPAKIVIRHIVSFTGFKEAKTKSKDVFSRDLRKKLKNKEPVPHEHRFHIRLPGEGDHANHPTGEDAGLRHAMAAPIRARIQELTKMGVHDPTAIRIHLRFLVENELFKGETPPPKTNRMFWPSRTAIYGCVYRYKQGGRSIRNKHFSRNYDVVPHNLIRTDNSNLLHQIVDEVGIDEPVERTVQSASVSAPKSLKTKTTSTRVKRLSNPLQHNKTTILTSLSQMNGTKQNILPIIKVINPSHYLGQGQLFLNSLRSQEKVIHLNANSPKTANKVQHKRKGTHQERDAQQQGHFFKLHQIQQSSNGVQEGQTSLVFMPSEAMHEQSNSVEIETTPTTSQQICQPSFETSLVINPSYNLGQGQLLLNSLRSQEKVIHLNANSPNTTNKVQRKRKGTHQDGDVQQQGHFKLRQIHSNGVEEYSIEAMHEWGDSVEIGTTSTTSQQICQPSIEASLEAQGASSDQCVLVEVQESECASGVENIYQQLSSTDYPSLLTDTYMEEVSTDTYIEDVSVLTSRLDGIESQQPTVFTNHSAPLCSSSVSELGRELLTTDSLHHIVHDHDYGNRLGKESSTVKPVDVSKNVTVQRQESNLKPNLELPTSCIEHLKDLLETRDIPNIVSAFINVPSLKLELLQQLVKKF